VDAAMTAAAAREIALCCFSLKRIGPQRQVDWRAPPNCEP
jgi:hypothetical protein